MTQEYRDAGVPFLRSQDVKPHRIEPVDLKFISPEFHKQIAKSALRPGDVVVVRTGTPGTAAVVPEWLPDANCADLVVIRPGPRVSPRFLAYFFNSRSGQHHVHAHTVGAVQQHFNVGAAREARLRLPELHEQQAIGDALGALDDKIELNRRINETLDAMARALFKSWFVDFDPVRRQGRSSIFPRRMAGHVPEGWRDATLDEVCCRIATGPFGSSIKAENFVPEGVPVIRGQNLADGFIDDGFVFLREEKADELRNANVVPGDIVFTHRGTLGQVGIIPEGAKFRRYVISQSQMFVRVNVELVSPLLAYFHFRAGRAMRELLAATATTGVPAIAQPTTTLKRIRVLVPPVEVSRAFEVVVGPMMAKAAAATRESETLAALRDCLLPKLLSGELRVRGAERSVERAV